MHIDQAKWVLSDYYKMANEHETADSQKPIDLVLMGDSISMHWFTTYRAAHRPGFVTRGISGQTTSQMLLRFRVDVVNIRPRVVHILAGTNDLSGAAGYIEDDAIVNNIATMVEVGRFNGIEALLGAVPPAPIDGRIGLLNNKLENYAKGANVPFIDYYKAMSDGCDRMKAGFADDEIHPNEQGYAVMTAIALPHIEAALARSASFASRRVKRKSELANTA